MNWAIYQSMARIPIGVAVTIEFLGPLAVAVIASRRLRDLAWVLLAGAGVALLGFTPEGLNLPGVAVRAAGRAVLGPVHPAQRADRAALVRPVRVGDRQPDRHARAHPAGGSRPVRGCSSRRC